MGFMFAVVAVSVTFESSRLQEIPLFRLTSLALISETLASQIQYRQPYGVQGIFLAHTTMCPTLRYLIRNGVH